MGLVPISNASDTALAVILILTFLFLCVVLLLFPTAIAALLSFMFAAAFHRPFWDIFTILCPITIIAFFYAILRR